MVPANTGPIPYSLPSLLEKCSKLAPSIAPTAVAPAFHFPVFLNVHLAAIKPSATMPLASAAASPAASAAHPAAVPLAGLMVQHRAALRAGRSLTFKIASGAIAASNLSRVAGEPTQTAIEMPCRLIISPNQYGAWAHASMPVSSQAGRTELWHDETEKTRIYFRSLSAIWAQDQGITANAPPAAERSQHHAVGHNV